MENHRLDTDAQVLFYENDFYPLSNFSAFSLVWEGLRFDTLEHVYHWEKFPNCPAARGAIQVAISAHEAFTIAQKYRNARRADWDNPEENGRALKVNIMRDLMLAKAEQHEYVHRKLLATGERELIEDSWRDDFWGWGENRDGQNWAGRLWMEIRAELRDAQQAKDEQVTYNLWNKE